MKKQFLIDKTEYLEKGIIAFPSIYIEGSASCGKTTAVQMLLKKHPEVRAAVISANLSAGREDGLKKELAAVSARMEAGPVWAVFDNIPGVLTREQMGLLEGFLENMPESGRAVFISRERPPEALLGWLWKRKMELIPMEALLFSREEIRQMIEQADSPLDPEEVYQATGGWAGCVDMMIRQSLRTRECKIPKEYAEKLRKSYEIDTYLNREVLSALSREEQKILDLSMSCPWLNAELCEKIWEIPRAQELLERLERKGILQYDRRQRCWETAPLFRREMSDGRRKKELGHWYEEKGYIREALNCLRQSEDQRAFRGCMTAHYEQIPFLGTDYSEVMKWTGKAPELCYLRGMYCWSSQNPDGLRREIRMLEEMEAGQESLKVREILLNLTFVSPDISLEEWLIRLKAAAEAGPKMRLYGMLGNSVTYLCGLRDLSGLFACTKKEENQKAGIWRECLGEREYRRYQLARLEYYLETERLKMIPESDMNLLLKGDPEENDSWQFQLARLYLLCKLQQTEADEENADRIDWLEERLLRERHPVCSANAAAVGCLYSPWYRGKERFLHWLRRAVMDAGVSVNEENYMMFCLRAQGYVLMDQYERAEKILRKTIPYLRTYGRSRLLAEQLFLSAIANWGEKRHGQALRDTIESFLLSGESRYVGFYTLYGEKSRVVLEAYVEWMRSNRPEGWHRKKKYNYGNVLRMPLEDYMQVILRCIRKNSRSGPQFAEEYIEERLTMMETIILQDIGRGLSNTEIARELNLKLSTVKSHIYSLYKKLGVNNRMQAVIKGKELGMLE